MPTPARVLIADDEPDVLRAMSEALRDAGVNVATADDGTSALAQLEAFAPDVLLTDVRMNVIGGLELLRLMRERAPHVDVILMTAYDDMETVVSAMRGGAVEFLVKPVSLAALLETVRRVLDDRATRGARSPTEGQSIRLGDLIGRDPRMIGVYKLVGQAAATNATVLIRGESGTGKELVARAIHGHAATSAEPFVPVNCAALPSTLLESELFGHTRGAFTGATADRRGRFAIAGRGTIFLDEIGDTSLDFQTKLLRVIQDREFQPVGAERVERTEARVIAATHQDLEAMITARRFREDLYYRLRVVEIVLPPLRERSSDIPFLVQGLAQRAATTLGLPVPVVADDTMEQLRVRRWPGNVRELENCIMRAMVIASGNVIRPHHLSVDFGESTSNEQSADLQSLDDVEREQVIRVLTATGGHRGRTAQILGVSRPRLARLLQKYELS